MLSRFSDLKIDKAAVIGAGPGGHAVAAVLSRYGVEVGWWSRNHAWVGSMHKLDRIVDVCGIDSFRVTVANITNDIERAIDGADIIFVVVPAFAHVDIAGLIASCCPEKTIIVLNPGRTAGALEFRSMLARQGCVMLPRIAESQSLLFTCRLKGLGCVDLMAVKKSNVLAAVPSELSSIEEDMLRSVYCGVVFAENTLVTSMSNIGAILHPAPVLLNTGWIESRSSTFFPHYYYGISKSIAEFLEEMDAERLAVASAFGVSVRSVIDWHGDVYGVKGDSLYETLQMNAEYASLDAPYSLTHRYITEDVPTGLVPMSELGKVAGVQTPKMDLIISLASSMLGCDFRAKGRNLERLGLKGKSASEVSRVFMGSAK